VELKLSQFDYYLPGKLIAQEPALRRDESRLLIINRKDKSLKQVIFKDIVKFINKDDLLVLNNTRVLPARLTAKRKTGGQLEILLLKEKNPGLWEVLVKPGRKARLGEDIFFAEGRFYAKILDRTPAGGRLIRFTPRPFAEQGSSKTEKVQGCCNPADIKNLINQYGKMPLPHYIKKELKAPEHYQTVYAQKEGAVAAPTAGLHFTKQLLKRLISRRVEIVYITLHCGLATFRPVKTPDIRDHQMEPEFYEIDSRTAGIINKAKAYGKRIVAVGTTVARAMEATVFKNQQGVYQLRPWQGETSLYIYPGYKFKIIDALLTNFHLPHSTNLIMVSAFAGIDLVREAYQYAIKKGFRFYSFGDAMLIM
jgi:S-adenosylmethionine:tRNA ribosyltransferase-isomerase